MKSANNSLRSLILISFIIWLVPNVFAVNGTTIGTATAIAKSSTWIEIAAPITGDDNNNSYTSVEILESGGWVLKDILNGPNEWRINSLGGLAPDTTYDLRFTFYDSDGVSGTNPQVVSVTTLSTALNSAILEPATVIMNDTEIFVSVPLTNDANHNSDGRFYVGTSPSGPWGEKCGFNLPFHPKKGRIRSLIPETDYYVRIVISDADGVIGTNPQIIGPIHYSGYENIALGKAISADPGWGCCPFPGQLVDGRIQYPNWMNGFAWTGGNANWAGGPAGWKQATIDFGEPTTFNRAVVWYHDPSSVPILWNFQYSDDGVTFFDAYINTEPCCRTYTVACYGAWYYPACGHDATFSSVTARYFRFTFDDRDLFGGLHGWASEIEVYNTIINQAPVAICQDIEILADENCLATIVAEDVDDGSYDPDGDETTLSVDNIGPFSIGEHFVTLTVTDEYDASDSCQAKVTVVDTTPPVITLSVSPNVLWPPNHKMALITPTINVSDNCDPSPLFELTSITMNEGDETNTYDPNYDTTLGDGKTTNDIEVDGSGNIYLRAERSGRGTGRIYTITYTGTDASGNTATATATVTVPHDQ